MDSFSPENVLIHYASPYYDPEKAREYYLRTRELKGRRSTKGMSENQKEAWSYSRNQIGESKKAELEKARVTRENEVEALRENAKAARERITAKLKQLSETLKGKLAEAETSFPVPKKPELNKIPENASPKVKEFLQRKNNEMIQRYSREVGKYEKKVSEAKTKIREDAKSTSETVRAASKEQREKVGNDLRASVEKARTTYEAAKKAIADKYEQATESEYENIRNKVQ